VPLCANAGEAIHSPNVSCIADLNSGTNERFTWSANLRHAAGVNHSMGPARSVVSRTTTAPGDAPISTHSPPPLPL